MATETKEIELLKEYEPRRRPIPDVAPFATGLHNPTHMDVLTDGRVLVSDHTAGMVMDITGGGDFVGAKPHAFNLEGPAGILEMDGSIFVSEAWGGRVADITRRGDARRSEPYASGLFGPYGLAGLKVDTGFRVFVGEKLPGMLINSDFEPGNVAQLTEITGGGTRDDFRPLLTEIPTKHGLPGKTRIGDWPDHWQRFATACCRKWAIAFPLRPQTPTRRPSQSADSPHLLYVSDGDLGHVVGVPHDGGAYGDVVASGNVVAWGLPGIAAMKEHPLDGLTYAPLFDPGTVQAIDPMQPRTYWFTPPIVQGISHPMCVRFSNDGETMYVCSSADGVVWKVTNFIDW
jgi:hypothetical protein